MFKNNDFRAFFAKNEKFDAQKSLAAKIFSLNVEF